jgi:hypothetical protein
VPGYLEWLGELGIGLPLIQSSSSPGAYISFCYWSFNWGRIVLQNVTVQGTKPYGSGLVMRAPMVVTETGGQHFPACTPGIPDNSRWKISMQMEVLHADAESLCSTLDQVLLHDLMLAYSVAKSGVHP